MHSKPKVALKDSSDGSNGIGSMHWNPMDRFTDLSIRTLFDSFGYVCENMGTT